MLSVDGCEGTIKRTAYPFVAQYSASEIDVGQRYPEAFCLLLRVSTPKTFNMIEDDRLPQTDPPTQVDLSEIRNGQEPRDTDVFVAIMGVTGAGKSTLISHLASAGVAPEIGRGLSSCSCQPADQLLFHHHTDSFCVKSRY